MGKVTLKDIAKKTGFSIKTVSRALNGHPDINIETKKKILKVAEELSYRPNLLARSLRQKKTYAIGYVIPDMLNEFFGEVAVAIENTIKKKNYSLLTSFTGSDPQMEIMGLELLASRQVDGIILATVGGTGTFIKKMVEVYKIPTVVIDNKVKGYKTDLVLHDNILCARKLTKHLIDHGHKHMGCIAGPLLETSGKRRLEGFKNALTESVLKIEDDFIEIADWKLEGGWQAAMNLFKNKHKKPTALFLGNSIMALGVLKAFKQLNIRVPEDVALVSFDNLIFTEATDPPLTTTGKVEEKIGRLAAELLLERIKKKDLANSREILVSADLCIRKSCGCHH